MRNLGLTFAVEDIPVELMSEGRMNTRDVRRCVKSGVGRNIKIVHDAKLLASNSDVGKSLLASESPLRPLLGDHSRTMALAMNGCN